MAAEEVHHGFLCAVIQEKRTEYQVLTEATLHNVPLRIIVVSRVELSVPEPTSDDGHIDTGRDQMDRGRMSKYVRRDSFSR